MWCSVQERRAICISEHEFGVCIPVTFKEHLNLDCRLWFISKIDSSSVYSVSSLEIFGLYLCQVIKNLMNGLHSRLTV